MAESNQAAEVEAQMQVVMKQHELALIKVIETRMSDLRAISPATFHPGLLMAEEFCRSLRKAYP